MFNKPIYLLSSVALLLSLNACSSGHAYNQKFGLVEDANVEKQLEKEELISKQELENFNKEALSLEEFIPPKGTFLAEDWVQPKVLITYLYPYDSKFYTEEELPKNKARLGDVVLKIPNSMSKEEFLLKLEAEEL